MFEFTLWRLIFLAFTLSCLLVQVESLQPHRYSDILNGISKDTSQDEYYNVLLHDNNTMDVEELYFAQHLDHFDPLNRETYQQRYFVTGRYLVENAKSAVTFLCVGGEGPGFDKNVLVNSDHCTGDMLELARILSQSYRVSVYVYALEHRYYGKSYPQFGDKESPVTTKNLKYLSSRQALEDLAYFVQSKSEEIGVEVGVTKWVTFGGSYPGYMAAYARIKYPHLIFAAVSSSAPLKLKVDFPEYQMRVGKDLKYPKVGGSDLCFDIVKQGHVEAVALLQGNPQELASMFHVCDPSNALLIQENQDLFLGDGLIWVPAQSNDPACKDGNLCNIQHLCDYMTHTKQFTNATELEILADVAAQQRSRVTRDCVDIDWKAAVKEYSEPRITSGGMRSWLWQTCTEFGFYQTCDETCPFASFYHLVEMDLELCKVAYNITNVYENVQATIDHYGGLNIGASSRVLSVNGDVDPWSELGLIVSPKYSLPAEMVTGASHHFWTHQVRDSDATEILRVREYIYSVVVDWLGINTSQRVSLHVRRK